MSSVLAMVLMAGMAAPGIGPGAVSVDTERELDLSGKWGGVLCDEWGRYYPVTLSEEGLFGVDPDAKEMRLVPFWDVREEGGGKFSMWGYRGIYQEVGPRLILCFREASEGHPAVFQGGHGQALLILRRVPPRK